MTASDSLVNEIKGKNPIDKIKSNKRRIKKEIATLDFDTYSEETLLSMVETMTLKEDELQYSLDLVNEIIKESTARLRLKAIERYWKANPDWQPIEKGDKLLAIADMVGAGYDDLSRYQIDTIYTVDKVVLLNYVGNDVNMHIYASSSPFDIVDMSVELAIEMREAYRKLYGGAK